MASFRITVGGEEFLVTLEGSLVTSVNGIPLSASLVREPGTRRVVLVNGGDTYRFAVVRNGDRYEVADGGAAFDVRVQSGYERFRKEIGSAHDPHDAKELRAPMPALVRGIPVSKGDQITAGQTLIILEAMKMENDVRASRAGRVADIVVQTGMTVEKDQLLLTLE